MQEGLGEIVFVLGMHRSGTSAVAESLAAMGYVVPGDMLEKDVRVNGRGFWESRDVVDINEKILQQMGHSWFDVFVPEEGWYRQEKFSFIKKNIKSFIKRELSKSDRLVIKDPRLCLSFLLWSDALSGLKCSVKLIYVFRNPVAVSRSLEQRDGFPLSVGELLSNTYSILAMSACRGMPSLALDYEYLLSDIKNKTVVAKFLGKKSASSAVWSDVFSQNLKHHATSESYIWAAWSGRVTSTWRHGQVMSAAVGKDVDSLSSAYLTWLQDNESWVAGINDATHSIVLSRQELMRLGQLHDHALDVISDKDAQIDFCIRDVNSCHKALVELEEAASKSVMLESTISQQREEISRYQSDIAGHVDYISKLSSRISELDSQSANLGMMAEQAMHLKAVVEDRENKILLLQRYVAQCETRLSELHVALTEFDALRVRLQEVESTLQQRDADVVNNAAYIAQCESRLSELHVALTEFDALRARLQEVESTLRQRDADVVNNAAYIAQCETRLSELHVALTEFDALRARLQEVESTLQQRDADVVNNAAYIAQCETRLSELHVALAEFDALRSRLQEVESTLQQRDDDLINNGEYIKKCSDHIAFLDRQIKQGERDLFQCNEYIAKCEARISSQDALMEEMLSSKDCLARELEDVRQLACQLKEKNAVIESALSDSMKESAVRQDQLQRLLSWRVVRWVNRYSFRSPSEND